MRRGLRGGIFGLVLVSAAGAAAMASPTASAAQPTNPGLTASGQVVGKLESGRNLTVTVSVVEQQGWQAITAIDIALILRGRTLDRVTLDPAHAILTVTGADQPEAAGLGGVISGAFFRVDASEVGLEARGTRFRTTIPITLLADPPAGARLYYEVSDRSFNSTGLRPLGSPAPRATGFSWGTLVVAALVALLAGGFLGSVFQSKRRPPQRLSVYGAVQRGLDRERSAQPGSGP